MHTLEDFSILGAFSSLGDFSSLGIAFWVPLLEDFSFLVWTSGVTLIVGLDKVSIVDLDKESIVDSDKELLPAKAVAFMDASFMHNLRKTSSRESILYWAISSSG